MGASDDPAVSRSDFERLDALLEEALTLVDADRATFLAEQPAALRAQLEALLHHCEVDAFAELETVVADAFKQCEPSPQDSVGSAGDWRLRQEIGAGGMGQVFLAEREVAGDHAEQAYRQQGAVKLLWSHRVDPSFRERFFQERRILASMDHPGLARFLDGGLLADGRPWFAMEYIEGQNVVRHSESQGSRQRVESFLELCSVIEYAHQRLILHRDIKPANVLVDTAGRIRVLDFGVAKLLGHASEESLTRTSGTPLTLPYASPEQVTGREMDVRTDIYQLGLLLYELVTGQIAQPVAHLPPTEAIRLICEEAPLPASRVSPSCDPALNAIIDKSVRKDPAQRYPSVSALAADLERYLAGKPVQARSQSAWYLLERFVSRHRWPVFSGLLLILGLGAAVLVSVNAAREARAEANRSRATQQILSDVFMQADPYDAGGDQITLADALVAAQPRIESRIQGDPQLAWEVNRTLAEIFVQLDLPELEAAAYESAWDAAKALSDGGEREAMYAIAGVGNLLARSDPAAAVTHFEAHLPDRPTEATMDFWLSAKYAEVGARLRLRDFESADDAIRTMADVAKVRQVENPRTLGRIQQLLAGAAYRAEDIDGADEAWARAVDYMKATEQPAAYAMTLTNMALHFGRTARYEESEQIFERALAVYRDAAVADTSYANALRAYASLLFRQGDSDGAIEKLEQALALLDPAAHTYSYLVAQRNAAEFRFIAGDMDGAWLAATDALTVALDHYGADSAVTDRIRPLLARWIYFAGRRALAARIAGVPADQPCPPAPGAEQAFDDRIAILIDHATLTEARRTAMDRWPASADLASLAASLDAYQTERPRFFDPLDDWRLLQRFAQKSDTSQLSSDHPLPRAIQRVGAQRETAQSILREEGTLADTLAERLADAAAGVCQ